MGGVILKLFYCKDCEYLKIIKIRGEEHYRCEKENCLSVYAKCVSTEALRQFIEKDYAKYGDSE